MSKPKNFITVGAAGLGIIILLYPVLLFPAILAPMYRAANSGFPDPLWWLGDPVSTLDTRAAIIQWFGVLLGWIAIVFGALLVMGLIQYSRQKGAAKAAKKA